MNSDISALKRSLTDRCQDVCSYLLPGGKRDGAEWVWDPGTGKVKIALSGPKTGVWSHFGGDVGGDLIDLWCYANSCDLKKALVEIREYLGVEHAPEPVRRKKTYERPIVPRSRQRDCAGMSYLLGRGLTREALLAYGIGVLPDGETISFPYRLPDGDVALVKVRKAGDGERPKPTESGCEPVLMGWHLVGDSRRICIVEGELDAPAGMMMLAGTEYEMPVLSVPFGGGGGQKQAWVENDWERLQCIEEVWLALDNDREGDAACEEIAHRLGPYRCRRVRLPKKDFNDALRSGVDVLKSFHAAEQMGGGKLKRACEFADQVIEIFHPEPGTHIGYTLPFRRAEAKMHFRPSEFSLWSGESGSGKSQLLNYCIPHWLSQGSIVTVASLEMVPQRTLARAVRQVGGGPLPSKEYIDRALNWLSGDNPKGGELLLFDFVGKSSVKELLDAFSYARMRYGSDQFVIDSLMRLGLDSDDYNGQEKTVYEMVNWAIETRAHLHLVAHNNKGLKEGVHRGQLGVKGAMEVVGNAFNQLEVVRNRFVEELRERHERGDELSEKEQKFLNAPGVTLYVNKQRNGDWEGSIPLWFDKDTYRYQDHQGKGFKKIYCE